MIEKKVLSVPESAKMLGISKAHAYNLVRSGKISSIRLGNRIVIPVQELENIINLVKK